MNVQMLAAIDTFHLLTAFASALRRFGEAHKLGAGQYLVGAICTGCHELDGIHDNGFGMVTPPLRQVAKDLHARRIPASDANRRGLRRTRRRVMSNVARSGFSHFTDGEIAAIHQYLTGS
jgi:mono/diheme cytochrome c family protein